MSTAVRPVRSGRDVHRSGGNLVHPAARWGEDLVDGMTDSQLAVMRGPDRDAGDVNVPRLIVSPTDGTITVEYEKGSTLYSNATPTGPVAQEEVPATSVVNAVAKL